MNKYVNVLVSSYKQDEEKVFTYGYSSDSFEDMEIGRRVIVPFGGKNKLTEGYVLSHIQNTNIDESVIKEIIDMPDDFSLFDEELLTLSKFISEKYCARLIDVLNTFVPQDIRSTKKSNAEVKMVRLADDFNEEMLAGYESKKSLISQKKVLDALLVNKEMALKDIISLLEISQSPVETLIKKGLIIAYEKDVKSKVKIDDESYILDREIILNDEQEDVFLSLKEPLIEGRFDEFLLKGITGSGKTEVYIRIIEEAIKLGKKAIVLVPEIGLTPQMLERFSKRFNTISVMHSRLTKLEKFIEWKRIRSGEVSVVIGPRSAIFMPIKDIGVIIIDEEHEMTYKSETSPKYDTIEVARFRAKYNNSVLVSASATPNIETYYKAKKGEIKLLELNKRYNNKGLPKINIVDMTKEFEEGNRSIFSRELKGMINKKLENRQQTILFLNRRGYSTFVSCRKCGHVMTCPNCNLPYVYHMDKNSLECHYCFHNMSNVSNCPNCGSKYIKYFGIGTQKIEDETKKEFKNARVLRMDKDTTSKKDSSFEILEKFKNKEADILIGTQMIAKGHDFPDVTLVGIIAADMMLNLQDFRAHERTFQLITQVAGRSGRADKEGLVYLQTYEPDHYVIKYASSYNYEDFYKTEIAMREQLKCPPFKSLFFIIFTGEDLKEVKEELNKLVKVLNYNTSFIQMDVEILGPGPSQISKINNVYRWQIMLRAENEMELKRYAMGCIKEYKKNNKNKKIQIQINFD